MLCLINNSTIQNFCDEDVVRSITDKQNRISFNKHCLAVIITSEMVVKKKTDNSSDILP